MKILHIAPSISRSYGGPTHTLASYLSTSLTIGAESDVAAPAGTPEEADALRQAGARAVITFPGYGSGGTARSPSLIRWVRRQARSYSVVHVHGLFNFVSTLAARAAIEQGVPVVIRPFGTLSRYTFGHRRTLLKRVWFRLLERPNLSRAAAVHFTSITERDEAERHGLSLGPRSHVVPPAFVLPAAEKACSEPSATVLFIGRLHPVKNLETLIDAWPSIAARCPDARLVVAGDGAIPYRKELVLRASRQPVSSTISFPGFLSGEEKAEAIAGSSLLVLPSFHENFGVAVLEGIASGIPVVISGHVHLRHFVERHALGVVASDSTRSLADSIVQALADSGLRERVARNGRGLVEESFGADAIGRELRSMYLAALDRSPANATDIRPAS